MQNRIASKSSLGKKDPQVLESIGSFRFTIFGIIGSIILFLALSPKLLNFAYPWYAPYFFAIVFSLMVFIRHARGKTNKLWRSTGLFYCILGFIPMAAMLVWSLVLFFLDIAGYTQVTRPLSQFLQYCCILLLVLSLVIEYGERVVDRLFNVVVCVCFVAFVYAITVIGFDGLMTYLVNLTTNNEYSTYFELHDICLTMPLFLFYYLRVDRTCKFRKIKIAAALIISILGFKRIALVAFLIVIVVSWFVGDLRKKEGSSFIRVAMQVGILAVSLAWVLVSSGGEFAHYLEQFGINPMGRNTLYHYFSPYASFDLTSAGQGIGFCGLTLESLVGTNTLEGLNGVLGLHNDLLRLLIEVGFLGLLLWLCYQTIVVPAIIGNRYGNRLKSLYLVITIYAFVVYMTDNAMGYVVFQTTLFLILASFTLRIRKDENAPRSL